MSLLVPAVAPWSQDRSRPWAVWLEGGSKMMTVHCRLLAALAVVFGLAGWGATAHADWAACQRKPTRACLLEEALRGDGAPLAGKDRLDILILAGAAIHPEYATDADIDEALRQAKAATGYNAYYFANLAIRGLVARKRTQEAADLVASLPSAHDNPDVDVHRAHARARASRRSRYGSCSSRSDGPRARPGRARHVRPLPGRRVPSRRWRRLERPRTRSSSSCR